MSAASEQRKWADREACLSAHVFRCEASISKASCVVQAAEKKGSRTVTRTSFRRYKDDESIEGQTDVRKNDMPHLWAGLKEPPLFLVDGYNIIGQWSKLKKKKDQGDMAGARYPAPPMHLPDPHPNFFT